MNKPSSRAHIDAELKLQIGAYPIELQVAVNTQPSSPATILAFVQQFADKIVQIGVDEASKAGKQISCKKGCGACCAQLVPVTEIEIRYIADMIKSMPKPMKKVIMLRFDAARQKLQDAGLWQQLITPNSFEISRTDEFAMNYFDLQIECPFLVEGACSIHVNRPIICREYLVTSDAAYCACPRDEKIEGVSIPLRLSTILGHVCEDDCHHHSHWVPLIVAPYWQALYPNLPSRKTGQEWIQQFMNKLAILTTTETTSESD